MADGVKMDMRGIDKSMARLRKIAPNVDAEIAKASKKNAEELAATAAQFAPKDTGDLATSIHAAPAPTTTGMLWAIWGSWYWNWVEHGTSERAGNPFFFPAYRLLRKRMKGRMKRAMTKAVKEALK